MVNSISDVKKPEELLNETKIVSGSVEKRVSQSLVALVVRQVIAYGAVFLGNIFLARWVSPDLYGLFAATLAFQTMLIVLGDMGLGAALIQRDQNPTQDELASLFTAQILLFSLIAGCIWVFAPQIAILINLEIAGTLIVRSVAVVFLITAFRSMPAMLLERDLHFNAIALVETVGIVLYQIVLLTLVWWDVGLTSIVWALAARYSCDVLLIWCLHPWRPRFSGNLRPIMSYLSFGLNMQGVRVMAYAKDYLPLLLIVPFLGATSAGHWGWSLTYIGIPVYFNQLIARIMFPAYSRVQSDKSAIGSLATMALWLNMSIGLPIIFILIWFAPHLVPLIYGNVWLAALPIAILLAPNMLAGFMTGALFPVLYATNQSRKALKLFVLWVILTVSGSLIGVMYGDLQGMALAYSCTTLIISIVLLFSVRPVAAVDLKKALVGPFVSLFGMIFGVAALVSVNTSWVFVLVFVICSYIVTFCVIDYRRIRTLAVAFLA